MGHWWELARQYLESNAFASGGLFIAAVGGVLVWLRKIPGTIGRWLWHRLVMEAVIDENEHAFYWIDEWFHTHPYAKRSHRIRFVMHRAGEEEGGAQVGVVPGDGQHLLRVPPMWLWVTHTREKNEGYGGRGSHTRSYTLRTMCWHRKRLLDLVEQSWERWQARTIAVPMVDLYVNQADHWAFGGRVPKRSPDSVVYPEGMWQAVVQDAEWFVAHEAWYTERGLPYRRGYLLAGPPGSGKSSLALVLASYLNYSVYVLNVNSPMISDQTLIELMTELPKQSVLLLEDVDGILVNRELDTKNNVTFGGLINAIDGLAAGRARILIMTTNHPDRLDPALIRPGRVDRRWDLGDATYEQAARLYERFVPDDSEGAAVFAAQVLERPVSMAALQEQLIARQMGHLRRDASGGREGSYTSTEQGSIPWRRT